MVAHDTTPSPSRDNGVRIPLDGATTARLHIAGGAENLALIADPAIDDLARAHFTGSVPLLTAHDSTIRVRHPRILRRPVRPAPATFRLNTSLPWTVEIHGGAQQLTADLRHGQLTGMTIQGGASNVAVELPQPRGTVRLEFAKGVHRLTILRPRHVAARLSVHGGARNAQFDDDVLGTVGGHLRRQTADYTEATDHYDITVRRGASDLTVAAAP